MATPANRLVPSKGAPYLVNRAVRLIIAGQALAEFNLTARALQLAACLAARTQPGNGDCRIWQSKGTKEQGLATAMGCSERTVVRRIAELSQAGVVEYAGQARSDGCGRFQNTHYRFTERVCALLGLAYLGRPGPTDAKALDGVTIIPDCDRPKPRKRATNAVPRASAHPGADRPTQPVPAPATDAADAPFTAIQPLPATTVQLPVKLNRRKPLVASGHVVSLRFASGPALAVSSRSTPGARASAHAGATASECVTIGGLRLPRELAWLCHEKTVMPTAVAMLMRKAGEHGTRLSDVVGTVRDRLEGKSGRHLIAYLSRLIEKPVDWSYVAKQRAAEAGARAKAAEAKAAVAAAKERLAGSWWVSPNGERLFVTAKATFVEVYRDGVHTGSTPLREDFLQAVEEGRVQPAAGPAKLAAPTLPAHPAQPAASTKPATLATLAAPATPESAAARFDVTRLRASLKRGGGA